MTREISGAFLLDLAEHITRRLTRAKFEKLLIRAGLYTLNELSQEDGDYRTISKNDLVRTVLEELRDRHLFEVFLEDLIEAQIISAKESLEFISSPREIDEISKASPHQDFAETATHHITNRLDQQEKNRSRFLSVLYTTTQGDRFMHVNMTEIGREIGLSDEEINGVTDYLSEEGLLKYVAFGGTIAITHRGVIAVENELTKETISSAPGLVNLNQTASTVQEWDAFICHGSEDKETLVRSLANALKKAGIRVWYDEFSLKVGDSLNRSINYGLAHSRFGVVIISPSFLQKEWPQKELDGLATRESHGLKVILPVWHNVDSDTIRGYSPILADKIAVFSSEGLDYVVQKLIEAITTS